MTKSDVTPLNARKESDVFDDLCNLCVSPGYIHAIAYFCWRDNFIRFSGEKVTEDDLKYQYSHNKLLRTEIATLIGLLVRRDIDIALPHPTNIQQYIDKTEILLHEMHMSLQRPWMTALKAIAHNPAQNGGIDPFSTAEGLREPIFYSGESAYNFQYIDLARKKYQDDDRWIKSNFSFSIDEACSVAKELGVIQNKKISNLRSHMIEAHLDSWTPLFGFMFEAHELEGPTGFPANKIERILMAFTIDMEKNNAFFPA